MTLLEEYGEDKEKKMEFQKNRKGLLKISWNPVWMPALFQRLLKYPCPELRKSKVS